jgi:hypothetical protein
MWAGQNILARFKDNSTITIIIALSVTVFFQNVDRYGGGA